MSDLVKVTLRPYRLVLHSGPQGPAGDGGAGAVDSVNGQSGVVVLDAADVGADAAGTAAGLVAAVTAASLGAVPTSRTISTTAPLTGGGTLAADRTLGITVGSSGGVQGWSANLDSYATVAPSAFTLTLFDDADQSTWRTTLGLGSAATQTAQVAPAVSRVPLSRSGLARLRPGWAREVGIGTPTGGEDNTLGYEVGDTWTYQGRHYVAESVATGAANWIAGLIASDATATPTASKIPIADGAGKLAAGWIPTGSGGVQAWDADLDAYAASPATATPTASRIPVADGSGKLDGWISSASTTVPGLVELATDLEASSSVVPTGADTRLGWAFRSLHLATGY